MVLGTRLKWSSPPTGYGRRSGRSSSTTRPVCAEFVAYRGAVPTSEAGADVPLDTELIWIGPSLHFVQYRIREGDLVNQVGVIRSDHYRPGSDDWGTPDELDARFETTCPEVQVAATALGRDRWWPMYDRDPVDNWTAGRVTLLGDAAHPMLQYLAQGACQAIEDAQVLAQSMAHSGSVEGALAQYQAARTPRTAKVQRYARLWGELWHTHDPLTITLRNHILTRRAADDYIDTDWLYGCHLASST